jgi:hypothetical protein
LRETQQAEEAVLTASRLQARIDEGQQARGELATTLEGSQLRNQESEALLQQSEHSRSALGQDNEHLRLQLQTNEAAVTRAQCVSIEAAAALEAMQREREQLKQEVVRLQSELAVFTVQTACG